MSDAFSHDLGWYLQNGWQIVSTAAYATPTANDDHDADRTFLVTVQHGRDVRVLGYEHFVAMDEDEPDVDPSPYLANFVKNLAGTI